MKTLFMDTEIFSEVPLKNGTHRYAEFSEILILAWAWNEDIVQTVSYPTADFIQSLVDEADTVVIHNSFFDRTVLAYNGVLIPVEKIDDTMANAYAHSLPGSLDQLCEVLGVPTDKAKSKEGKRLIRLFCVPRPKNQKLRRANEDTHPKEWEEFVAYAGQDIIAMRECRKRTPRWNITPMERKLWYLDQKINDRGIKVDIELAHAAIRAADRAQEMLAARIAKITDGKVGSATQRAKLIEYLGEEHDYALVDMKKGTVATELKDAAMPDEVRELLEIRQQASATSTAKYPVLIAAASTRDDRLRGTLQFCGASRTGRWGGRIFQPQNLMRPTVKHELIDMCIAALKADCEDLIFVEMLDDKGKKILANVMEMLGNAVRGSLIAEKDKKFVISDLSNIEGRVLAWLAGEEWKVKAFAEFDKGIGHDIYVLAYARAFGVTPEVVLDDKKNGVGLMRAIGKVMELACIAEGQQVLTDSGLRAIEDIRLIDRVWDGVEFVTHEGVVCRGEKTVGTYDGLEATADHLVFVEGKSQPIPFEQAAKNRSHLTRCETGGTPIWVGENNISRPSLHERMEQALRSGTLRRLWARLLDKFTEFNSWSFQRMPALQSTTSSAEMAGTSMFGGISTLQQSEKRAVPRLWSAWNNFRFFFTNSHGRVGSGKYWFAEDQRAGPNSQRQGVLSGQSPMVDENQQHSELQNKRTAKTYDILNAGPRNRFTANGRLVHNCGYGGGAGAFEKMAAIYGVQLSAEKIDETVKAWRKSNSKIKSFWYDVEWACRQALRNKGEKFVCRMLEMDRVDFNEMRWLRIKLPSGRYLSYPAGDEDESGQIVYDGINQYTKKWEQLDSYGPKFCIAAGTPVLTKKGWKAIERVTAADLVWDGLEWVKQDGLARNGVKDVISAHGVWMTPDHKILMEQGWVDASQSAGHKRAESRLPEGFDIRRKRREAVLLESSMRVRACIPASFRSNTELQESRKSCFLRVQEKRKHRKEKYYTRYVEASGIRSVAIDDRSLLYTNTPILEKLRRQRNKSLPSLAAGVREFLGGHGPVLQTRPYSGETEQQRRVFQEKLPVGNTQEAGTKQARQSFGRHALGSHDGIRSSRKIRYRKHDTALSSFSRSFDETVVFETRRKSEVFDLVNCGPRNRFVVMDKDGNPLIVHNCENIVQAVSRDILSRGLMEAEETGYEVCLHIHDEAVTETDDDPKYNAEGLSKILAKTRSWTVGLPLAAAGFCCSRSRKD